MSKPVQIIFILVALFFLTAGIKTISDSKNYDELSNILHLNGVIHQLQCPQKGAASLALKENDNTFHLSIKFRTTYCDGTKPELLLGKPARIEAIPVTEGYYQIYKLSVDGEQLLSPEDVIADRQNSIIGLFFIAFLLIGIVIYKRNKAAKVGP